MEELSPDLIEAVKVNRNVAHVIQIEEDIITLFNQKVRRVSDNMWRRYTLLQNEVTEDERSKQQGKMNTLAKLEIEEKPDIWISFKEFAGKRSEKDIYLLREYFSLESASV